MRLELTLILRSSSQYVVYLEYIQEVDTKFLSVPMQSCRPKLEGVKDSGTFTSPIVS